MGTKLFQSALIAFTAILVSLAAYTLQWLDPAENLLWDVRVKQLADPADHDPSVKMILIDQSSLDWAESSNALSWPWPREMYTAITDFCRQGGAKTVIFDLLFLEPSVYGPTDDARFADALRHIDSIGTVALSNSQGDAASWPSAIANRINTPEETVVPAVLTKQKAAFPVEPIGNAFSALGSVVATPDEDGVVRRIQLMYAFDGVKVPSLSLAALLDTDSAVRYVQDASRFCLNDRCQRLDRDFKAIINYHGPTQTYDTFNAAAVIESKLLSDEGEKGSVEPADLNGSYIFVGVSAPGLMDVRSTPIQGVYPGTEVHATVLDNLLHGDFITKTPLPYLLILLFLLTTVNSAGIRFNDSLARASLYPIITCAVIVLSGVIAYRWNSWLEMTPLLLAVMLSSVGAFSLNYLIEGRQRRFIRSAFAQYLSPQVIDSLIAQPETLKLGGRKETLTLLFSDIEGFTSISTQMDAERVGQFLNDYLGLLSNAMMELGGTIDKYEGDAIIAFWNAPLPQKDHAVLAVRAALTCLQLLREHHDRLLDTYGHAIKTRFGVHTGEVIIGNLGTEKRFDYTFIGDAGNLASRLESANKQFHSYIMISEDTKTLVEHIYPCRQLGTITVVGRNTPLKVFEPMERHDAEAKTALLQRYHEALGTLYNGNVQEARALFEAIASEDPVSARYLEIIQGIETGTILLENGVLKLKEK